MNNRSHGCVRRASFPGILPVERDEVLCTAFVPHQVKDWVKELHAIVGAGIILVIAGNKADLERSRVVKTETAEAYVFFFRVEERRGFITYPPLRYAKTVGASHFLTSAKANKGIDSVFNDIGTSTTLMPV